MRERRIREHDIRNEPITRLAVPAGHVVPDDPEIIDRHVRELRTASAFADRPDAGGGRLQSLIDLKPRVSTAIPASSSPIPAVFAMRPVATSR
jgi:hypothetical protein